MIYKSRKSQSILDFVLIFGILLVFLVGLTRIWGWFNTNYAKRNVDYQNSRRDAGTAEDSKAGKYTDKTLALNDDWVFKGIPSGTVGLPPGAVDIPDDPDDPGGDPACVNARESAASLRDQAHGFKCQAADLGSFDCEGDDTCENNIRITQRRLRRQAREFMAEADNIEMAGCGVILPYHEPRCP